MARAGRWSSWWRGRGQGGEEVVTWPWRGRWGGCGGGRGDVAVARARRWLLWWSRWRGRGEGKEMVVGRGRGDNGMCCCCCCCSYLVVTLQHAGSVSGIGGERWWGCTHLLPSLPAPILSSCRLCPCRLERGIAVAARATARRRRCSCVDRLSVSCGYCCLYLVVTSQEGVAIIVSDGGGGRCTRMGGMVLRWFGVWM